MQPSRRNRYGAKEFGLGQGPTLPPGFCRMFPWGARSGRASTELCPRCAPCFP